MRNKSKKNNQDQRVLFQLLADLRDPREVESVLKTLLSKSELGTIAKKIIIAKALRGGESYRQIREKFQASTATIAQVQKSIQDQKGLSLALEKIATDEWAEEWTEKIRKLFTRF